MARKPTEQLSLRFYEPNQPKVHSVPAAALAQSVDALQRLIWLLALRHEGHAPGQRIRPSAELQRRYQLRCELPAEGSYLAPVRIEGAELLGPADIAVVTRELAQLLSAVGLTSESEVEAAIPDETWRRFALEAVERLAPQRTTGVELEIRQGITSLLDTKKSRPFVERVRRNPTRERVAGAIVGDFKRIDFAKQEITLLHRTSSRELTGQYNSAIEEALLENPRATLIAYGTVVKNSQGQPTSLDTIDRIEAVELGTYDVTSFLNDNIKVLPGERLRAELSFDESDLMFEARIASLKVDVFSETYDGLLNAIRSELAMLWKRYAKADDKKLTPAARELKKRLHAAFSEEE